MKKLLFTLFSAFAIFSVASAQSSDFKPTGNLWGYTFGDYYYMSHSDSLGRGAGNVQYKPFSTGNNGTNNFTTANAFQIRRAYLGYDYQFAPKLTSYIVLADEQNLDNNGYNTFYLKYANVKWSNFLPNQNLVIGQYTTSSFAATPFGTEPLWGYRSVERTIMDMHNMDASSDLGVALDGYLWKGLSGDSIKPNVIGYSLQMGNGNSAKPESDIFKKYRLSIYTSLLQQKLTIGVYGDIYTASNSPVISRVSTYKGYISYKTKKFKIGTEVVTENWSNGATLYTKAHQDVQVFGWSIFCSGKILENLNFFARLDIFNPDINYHASDTVHSLVSAPAGIIKPSYLPVASVTATTPAAQNYVYYTNKATSTQIAQAAIFSRQIFYTLGLDYTVDKRFHIMPNIWVTDFKSLVNIPGATHANFDYDFVPRVTFYYLFNGSKSVNNNGMDN